jgi:glycosyltransferase involved in cell wall biosynthesis
LNPSLFSMRCPTLKELPPPPPGKAAWPWTEETPLPKDRSTGSGGHPRISIVTTSYNQGAYLEETIRSVLLQGYPDLEYILIDGGSSDGSREIIERYAPWLAYWVSEPDRGQSQAINKGFRRCTGELLTFLSSDDTYLPSTFLDLARRWAPNAPHGAIIGGFRFQDQDSVPAAGFIPARLLTPAPLDLTLGPPGIYRLHQVSTFYTRPGLEAVGRRVREDLHYVMDRELLYRVCRKFPVLLVDRPYGVFRRHETGKSSAALLAFAREFADLYRSSLSGDPAQDRRRKKMARYRLARGYSQQARIEKGWGRGAGHLARAALMQPGLLGQRNFARNWLRLFSPQRSFPF